MAFENENEFLRFDFVLGSLFLGVPLRDRLRRTG